MGLRTVRHPFYTDPEKFGKLVQSLVAELIAQHAEEGRNHLREGQYLVLHSVSRGEYHIPVFVHVKREYDGIHIYVHPLPLDGEVANALRRKGMHTPYGIFALDYLYHVLREGKHTDAVSKSEFIAERLVTKRSQIRYPPLPEYADDYIANKLLQEREDGKYYLNRNNVFVGEYHEKDGWRLERYDPNRHEIWNLKTVYFDDLTAKRVAHVDHGEYMRIRNAVMKRKGGVQKHFGHVQQFVKA